MIFASLRRLRQILCLSGPPARTLSRAVRPALEALEDRLTPAFITVSSPSSSIQAAINSAPAGSVIQLGSGVYQQQVTINKSITLVGACNNTTIIEAPTNLPAATTANPAAIVHVTGNGTYASITNLTVAGPSGGAANLEYGIRVDGNAFADIEHDTVTNIIDSSNGGFGVAIDLGNTGSYDGTSDQVGFAVIANDYITNYQRAGIVIDHATSLAAVWNNTIAGGPASTADSVTGVEVSDGAYADIEYNTITGNTNTSNGVGVLLYNTGTLPFWWGWGFGCGFNFGYGAATTVANNHISGNDYGIYGADVTATSGGGWCSPPVSANIANNQDYSNTYDAIEFDNSTHLSITNNQLWSNGSDNQADGGIYFSQTTDSVVTNNQAKNDDGSGIYLDAGSTGNTLQNNVATGNVYNPSTVGNADVVDLSTGNGTAGTANTWCNTQGQTYITVSGYSLFAPQHQTPPPSWHYFCHSHHCGWY